MNIEVIKRKDWMISILPEPFKSEFKEDVLDSESDYDMKTLEKVFTYYIQDCWNELPVSVKNIIEEEYFMIELP